MSNNKPTHRVLFCRIDGQDEQGRDKLGRSTQIGAVWPREGKSAIIRLDVTPVELTRNEGVLFLAEVGQFDTQT